MPRHGFANIATAPGYTTATYPDAQGEADARAERGWNSYVRGGQEAVAFDHEQIATEHERLANELERSRLLREAAYTKDMAEKKKLADEMGPKFLEEMKSIDPNSPDAPTRHLELALKYHPLLFGDIPDKKMAELFEHRRKSIDAVQALNEQVQSRKSAAAEAERARKEAAEIRQSDIGDRQTERLAQQKALADQKQDHDFDMAQMRADLLKARGPSDAAVTRYNIADQEAKNAEKQMNGTQGYIDALEKRGDANLSKEEKTRLEELRYSKEKWSAQLDKHNDIKNAFEAVHPELNPNFKSKTDVPESSQQAGAEPNQQQISDTMDAQTAAFGTPETSPATADTPHPYEGKRVLQKSTGKYGTFVNGQFVPES